MPQLEHSIIRTLIESSIKLDVLEILDVDEGTHPNIPEKGHKQSKTLGSQYPLIQINGKIFNVDEVISLKLDTTGFLPNISIKVQGYASSNFISESIPKDGDLINLFIRSRNDAFKPIRNDYLITSVSTFGGDGEGDGMVISMNGELNVPGIYDDVIKSYDGTSYEVMQEVAKELFLGFASNDTSTLDKQIWINPNGTRYNLLHNIASTAWKDENSFFSVFIDIYYNVNFININNQFSDDDRIDDGLVDMLITDDSLSEERISNDGLFKKLFTNHKDFMGTNIFIDNFKIINTSSQISNTYGYKIHSIFFDNKTIDKYDIFVDPLQYDGAANDNILLKGRANDDAYKTQVKKKWMGVQYSDENNGNVHDKYIFSQSHNLLNLKEIDKMNLSITVPRANFNIIRCERIPCAFFITSDPVRAFNAADSGDEESSFQNGGVMAYDKFYSGHYMVKGMMFEYKNVDANNNTSVFEEKVFLTRRAWPTP